MYTNKYAVEWYGGPQDGSQIDLPPGRYEVYIHHIDTDPVEKVRYNVKLALTREGFKRYIDWHHPQ